MQFRTILVPVDGSEGANGAARFAAALARATGARLLLLNVFGDPSLGLLGLAQLPRAELDNAIERVSRGSFEAARRALGDDAGALNVETLTGMGDPALEIVGLAKQHDAQLIVMGSRGLSPMRELLVGSVSEKVLRHAHCPVTIVR